MDTNIIEREAMALSPGDDLQKILELRDKAKFMMEIGKRVSAVADAALLQHILATKQPVEVGENLYIAVSTEKKTKCRDNGKALEALFDACGGDFESVANFLASNAWKYGECRVPLGDAWDQHFEVTETLILEDGVPAKRLSTMNKNFLK